MSSKANKAIKAVLLGSLLLIFGAHLSLFPAVAKAHESFEAVGEIEEDADFDDVNKGKFEKDEAEENDDEELLKLAMDMKLAEKDLEALLDQEKNQVRFFDPEINKSLIDRELLEKLMHMQQAFLEDFDKNKPVEEELKDVDLDDLEDIDMEDMEDLDGKEIEKEVNPEVKLLDDDELMKIALKMKLMEKDMEDFLKKDDSTWTVFFDPVFNKGLIDRPLLLRLLLLRQGLLNAFDNRVVGLGPFAPRPFFGANPFFGDRSRFED